MSTEQEQVQQEAPQEKKAIKKKDIKRLEGEAFIKAEQELETARATFKDQLQQYEQTKFRIVQQLGDQLMAILPEEQHKSIAGRVKRYFAKKESDGEIELISKTTIYAALPANCKDEERSKSISEGRRASPTSDNSSSVVSSGPLGGKNPNASLSYQTLRDIVNEVIAKAVEDGDSYRVPKEVFDKLVIAAPRIAA